MKCECGGVLRKAVLSRFDFSAYAGIPVTLVDAPGFRCSACGREALGGALINRALQLLVQTIVTGPHRLTAEGARFLRKSMRLTQQQLADKLGANRITVTNWERGEAPISKEHDLMLRSIVSAYLLRAERGRPKREEIAQAIDHARTEIAPMAAPPFVIADLIARMDKAAPDASRRS